MSGSGSSTLDNASNDANQNMGPAPAGSPAQSCGTPSDSSSNPPVSPTKLHWIGIQLVDELGHVVPYEDYRITLPDGTALEGSLDKHGRAKLTGIDGGSCKVSFPYRDADSWKKS
jgi:type VI secretion system secreted protein VgrG